MATSFKPKNANATSQVRDDNFNAPVPRGGSRKARVSLIVDLGIQARDDFEDPITKELKPQKPCQQVVMFADLTSDVVDYGAIGKAPYRLMLNGVFDRKIKGINFTATAPKDAKGNIMQGKPWGFHPASLLTKVAKAVKKPEVITSMDITQLLDIPLMVTVDVSEKASGKMNAKGEEIIYKNVNYKGCSEVPLDDNDEPIVVAPLQCKPMCITFDDVQPNQIKFIRKNVLELIKQATNFEGSQMQKAIELFEAGAFDEDENSEVSNVVKSEDVKHAGKAVNVPKKVIVKDIEPSDCPF